MPPLLVYEGRKVLQYRSKVRPLVSPVRSQRHTHRRCRCKPSPEAHVPQNLYSGTHTVTLLRPEVIQILHRSARRKGKKAKFYHDLQAKQLPELQIGQEVRMDTLDYAEITRGNMVPTLRSFRTNHSSHNQVTAH